MPIDRVTVLTSCTGLKHQGDIAVAAESLYTGQQHVRLMRGVRALREAGTTVDVWIVSAGHGVVHGSEPLAPYNRTFQGRPTTERRDMASDLNIPADVRTVLGQATELAIVTLSEEYLDACGLASDITVGGPLLLLCSTSASLRVPGIFNGVVIPLRTAHTRDFHCGYVGLKGEVAGRLLWALAEERLTVADAMHASVLQTLAVSGPVESALAGRLF
jgi:hypothetical protein